MSVARHRRVVLVVDDQPVIRTLVAEALRTAGFDAVAVAGAAEAIERFDELDPDILVADIDLGSRPNGTELATILTARAPHLATVFLSNYSSIGQVPGRRHLPGPLTDRWGFVSKAHLDTIAPLVEAVEAALMDERPRAAVPSEPSSPLDALSSSQLGTLRLMAEGWSNTEIATQQGTTLRAVEKVITRIFVTLGLSQDARRNPRVGATTAYIAVFGPPHARDLS